MGESNTNNTVVNFNSGYSSADSSSNTWNDGFRSYGVGTSDDLDVTTGQYNISQDARVNSIKFRNLSIHGAKWGIYALCNYLSVEDCKFYNCGWSGDIGDYSATDSNFFYGSVVVVVVIHLL